MIDDARKQAILAQVAQVLEQWPDGEPLPAGIDPALQGSEAPLPDLASLAAELAAVTREVQIAGKAHKRLHELLEPLLAPLGALPGRLEGLTHAAAEAEAERWLAALLDLHDRLTRAVEEGRAAGARLPWLARLGGAPATLAAVLRGVALTLDRLEELLALAGVRKIDSTGAPFDPERMRAVDTAAASAGVAAGRVAATLRAGFERQGKVLRCAEVTVAR